MLEVNGLLSCWQFCRSRDEVLDVCEQCRAVMLSGHNKPISKATLLRNRGSVEVSLGERAARAGLQIALEPSGRLLMSELDHHMEIPRAT